MVNGPLCLLHRQMYALPAGNAYACVTWLTLGSICSKDALKSHTNNTHLGCVRRERNKKWEAMVPVRHMLPFRSCSEHPAVPCVCLKTSVTLALRVTSQATYRVSALSYQHRCPHLRAKLWPEQHPAEEARCCLHALQIFPLFGWDPFLTAQKDADTPMGCSFGERATTLGRTHAPTGRQSYH